MKKSILCCLCLISLWMSAGNYTVGVGNSTVVYCTANAPAGYITHCWWNVVNASDGEYVAFSYTPSDLYCTVYGLKAKANIQVEVTYAYSFMGSYDNNIHVGHASYYDYITITGGVTPTEVTIDQGSDVHMAVGETITLTASLTPSNASTSFSWGTISGFGSPTSFDISYMGKYCYIYAKRPNYIQLVCQTENGLIDICKVTADNISPTAVRLPEQMTIYMGEPTLINPTLTPSTAYSEYYSWVISKNIISITDKTITPLSTGETVIYCTTSNGIESNRCKVLVKFREPEDIYFNSDTMNITIGSSKPLLYTISPNNALSEVSWEIREGKDVVSISNDGIVTGLKAGIALILATTTNGLSDACIIVVKPELQSISIPKQVNMLIGETFCLEPIITPKDALINDLEWTTSDSQIAEINDNIITAKGLGNAEITAYLGSKSLAKTHIYVKKMLFVNVWTKEEKRISIPLYEIPTLSYLQDSILITSPNREITFALSDIVKITLADNNETIIHADDTIPENINDIIKQNNFRIIENSIFITSLLPNDIINIYSVSGQLICQMKSDNAGKADIDISRIPRGIYIIRTNNFTFKILKK